MADAADPPASAHWWAETLGWEVTFETRHEVAVEPPAGRPGLPLVFVPVPDHKSASCAQGKPLGCPTVVELAQEAVPPLVMEALCSVRSAGSWSATR